MLQNQKVSGGFDRQSMELDMADYPKKDYSNKAIIGAGAKLREHLPYSDEAIEVFKVAHNWRDSHAYPMMVEKTRLTKLSNGALTAGRIKRMASIRKKLRRTPITLKQIQDLAGIRAIVPDMVAVRALAAQYTQGAKSHRVAKVNDYIAAPKKGGYRCFHMVSAFEGGGKGEEYKGQKVEIQIRTELQHVWATAVEAIGSMRGEDLKAGEGCERWLRLLELMSAQFSETEKEPLSQYVPQSFDARRDEIQHLCGELDAISHLETYHKIVHVTESRKTNNSSYFLVHMDAASGNITVKPQVTFMRGAEGYQSRVVTSEKNQTILVSVDSVAALRAAYPNYFLDVKKFLHELTVVAEGFGRSRPIAKLGFGFLKDFGLSD